MEKKETILKISIIVVIIISVIALAVKKENKKPIKETEGVTVIPTMYDEITKDTAWSPTFQLVWNDLKNEVVKQDITFKTKNKAVENLNKEYFTEDMISGDYYYKNYGLKTLELKKEIEKGIKEKFNQESDILNDFSWNEEDLNNNESNTKRYFFYSMLYREFEYKYKFETLDNASFGDKENVRYFGINTKSGEKVRSQIRVLFYNNSDEFAVSVTTKNNDEVIFYKNPNGDTFATIYENLLKNKEEYSGDEKLSNEDTFKAPYIDLKVKQEYKELENKKFLAKDGDECEIYQALQSIEFRLDETGGKVKSEASMDMTKTVSIGPDDVRYFNVDNTFALFIKEENKDVPYFALKVDDITKYQQ